MPHAAAQGPVLTLGISSAISIMFLWSECVRTAVKNENKDILAGLPRDAAQFLFAAS